LSGNGASEKIVNNIRDNRIDFVELWFVDIFGELHSVGMPSYSLTEEHFEKGLDKLDASSIRGFTNVNKSDMILLPDASTFRILPPCYDNGKRKNARLFVDLYEESNPSRTRYNRDSRIIASTATIELKNFGLTHASWGPEVEFFIFDKIKLFPSSIGAMLSYGGSGYYIESNEAPWAQVNTNTRIDFKQGYYSAQPRDTLVSIRKDICDDLYRYFGIKVEAQHHEVATSGQCEINLVNGDTIQMADAVVTVKNLVKVKSNSKGKVATFMSKPIYGDNATAMHVHQSLWNNEKNVMYDPNDKIAELSQVGRYYIGGILDHAAALCAISNPTTNSYKRLMPNFEAPVNVCWGISNRSSAIRIPMYSKGNEQSKRIEYRVPDPTANIYLLEAALLLAGLDGIRKKIDPGDPIESNVYNMTPEQRRNHKILSLPANLKDALDALQCDYKFLEHIFTKDLLDTYSSIKYNEYAEFAQTPTPWEVAMYADV